ncbi:unnamed protein product [Cuscuta campestris]|uniref:Retrotransposon gag domain-containing protein n=1 Tax=Cuscuta campestris TaxID=132261 RepID=A0A484MLM5_9ASTE|nr:unnamed protein product [Cuscuta campestris]
MSNPPRSMSHEELVAANTALQAQVEYLAKEVAKLTKQKMSMLQDSEDEEEASSSNTMRARAHEKSHSDFKVDIPIFEGKNDPDEFLEWLETVERVFDFKEVSDDKKVKIVALKFRKYASTWWTNTCTKRIRSEKPLVDSWQKMRSLLKKKFLPTEYSRENFAKLQTLRQGTKSVEDYTREFEELLLRCDLQENEEQTFELYKEDEDFKDTFSKCLLRPHGEFLIKDAASRSSMRVLAAAVKLDASEGRAVSWPGPWGRCSGERPLVTGDVKGFLAKGEGKGEGNDVILDLWVWDIITVAEMIAQGVLVMLPESPKSQIVQEVKHTEGPVSKPPSSAAPEMLEEPVILTCVEDTSPEEPVLEKFEPKTDPFDCDTDESDKSINEELPCDADRIHPIYRSS